MSTPVYATLQQVIEDPLFPELDVGLRQGRHIGPDDIGLHSFVAAAQPLLEEFYHRYGCDLVFAKDQVVYLLPRGDLWGRRRLTLGEMLVGQALALLYLDPSTTASAGRIRATSPLDVLVGVLGKDAAATALVGRRAGKRVETHDAEQAQKEVHKALRTLARLGFVRLEDEDHVRLGAALGRFIEPVQRAADPRTALATLMSKGMVELDEDDEPPA